jgi:hyperosmotically inducible protein
MQLSRIALAVALASAVGGTLVTTGCASTRTQSSAGEVVDDSLITAKVKAKFVEDKEVGAMNINVETFKGTVQLSGFANNAAEMNKAAELARSVKGVNAVRNDIRLKSAG